MADDQLDTFKREINLVEYAMSCGYVPLRHESSRNSAVLKHEGGDKIVVARNGNGHWIYFAVHDSGDNGTIVDFLLKRDARGNLGRVRWLLASWSGYVRPEPCLQSSFCFDLHASAPDRARVVRSVAAMEVVTEHAYLETRGLSREVLGHDRLQGRLRRDARGNAVFLHEDAEGICGYELKNRGFTGFAPGGEKGLWRSNPREGNAALIIAESAIDAMSYFAVVGREGLYISTAGAWGLRTGDLILTELDRLPKKSELVLAFDNDAQGGEYVRQATALLAGREHLIVLAQPPSPHKDWNDVLRATGDKAVSLEAPPHGARIAKEQQRRR